MEPSDDRGPDPRAFRPLAVEAAQDHRHDREPAALRSRIDGWVRDALAPALAVAWPRFQAGSPVRLGLEVVCPGGPERWTLTTSEGATTVERGLADDLDVLNLVTGSGLADVLDGHRAWGHLLLAGELRASDRAYRIAARGGLRRLPVAPIFLYYALPYAESTRRATMAELDAVLAGRPPPWARALPEAAP